MLGLFLQDEPWFREEPRPLVANHPVFPGTFSILTQKVLLPGKPLCPSYTKTVGHLSLVLDLPWLKGCAHFKAQSAPLVTLQFSFPMGGWGPYLPPFKPLSSSLTPLTQEMVQEGLRTEPHSAAFYVPSLQPFVWKLFVRWLLMSGRNKRGVLSLPCSKLGAESLEHTFHSHLTFEMPLLDSLKWLCFGLVHRDVSTAADWEKHCLLHTSVLVVIVPAHLADVCFSTSLLPKEACGFLMHTREQSRVVFGCLHLDIKKDLGLNPSFVTFK